MLFEKFIMYKRVFIFFVFLFVDGGDLKTNEETFNKKWLVCFEFISVELFNLYLPKYRGRSHAMRVDIVY